MNSGLVTALIGVAWLALLLGTIWFVARRRSHRLRGGNSGRPYPFEGAGQPGPAASRHADGHHGGLSGGHHGGGGDFGGGHH